MNRVAQYCCLLPLALLAGGLSGCATTIPPGHAAIIFDANSGIKQHLLRPRFVWTNPFTQRLIVYPTSITTASYVQSSSEGERRGDDSIKSVTQEGAILPMDVSVTYRVRADDEGLRTVFEQFGTTDIHEIQEEHIRTAAQVAVNEVTGREGIFDLISKDRNKLGPAVKEEMKPFMDRWGFVLDDVSIREVHPQKEITERIVAQQNARQEMERAKIALKQAAVEAQTTLVNAQKTAEQNRLLSQQGKQALQLKKLELYQEFVKKWNGRSPIIGTSPVPSPQ